MIAKSQELTRPLHCSWSIREDGAEVFTCKGAAEVLSPEELAEVETLLAELATTPAR